VLPHDRLQYTCESVTKHKEAEVVKLRAVSGDANKPWSKYTPAGEFSATITNPEAFDKFEPGKDYLLNITEAPSE
jgi:hypothetical protein